jgi:predicted DNA-binding protein
MSSQDERITINVSHDLAERCRNAAWATRTPLATIGREALENYVCAMERGHGKQFGQRDSELNVGRPATK